MSFQLISSRCLNSSKFSISSALNASSINLKRSFGSKSSSSASVFKTLNAQSLVYKPAQSQFVKFFTNKSLGSAGFVSSKWYRAYSDFPGNVSSTARSQTVGVGELPQKVDVKVNGGLKNPPMVSSKSVAYWLLICGAAVFGIVVLGGLTRLTESGLSITEWKPITGALPPRSLEDWEKEFALYKESPEFQQLNSDMTLDDYKFIYFMEWGHRLWGRAIGLLVVLPGLYFVARGKTSPQTNRWLVGITALLGLQGAIGWWMVHSGIDRENLASRADSHPRVSHYRLATHLGAAFLLFMAMTYTGLDILKQQRYLRNPAEAVKEIKILSSPLASGSRKFAVVLLLMALATSMSGAFVAGLDAGLLYNDWPLMGNRLVPSNNELFEKRYTREENPTNLKLIYSNMMDNPVTVQFIHRMLATATWTACLAYFIYARRRRNILPRSVYKGAHGVIGFASLQALLGITTLVYIVPIPLAAMHQGGAIAFLTSILVLLCRLRVPRPQLRKFLTLMSQSK